MYVHALYRKECKSVYYMIHVRIDISLIRAARISMWNYPNNRLVPMWQLKSAVL